MSVEQPKAESVFAMPSALRSNRSRHAGKLRPPGCIVICLLLVACAAKPPGTIRDLEVLPQDVGCYLHDLPDPFVPPDRQRQWYQAFVTRFFGPWGRNTPKHAAEEVFSGLKRYQTKEMYGENNLPLPPDWIDEMAEKSNPAVYPSRHLPAIAVVHASMRVLPTHKPAFYSSSQPGEGFPFDRMQNSLVAAGTPLLVTHVSRDGQWALVETDWAAGWVRWPEIALVDRAFIAAYTATPLAGFLADDVAVMRPDGLFLLSGRVGMALPLAGAQDLPEQRWVRLPVRDHLGQARMVEATAPRKDCQKLPLAATRSNVVRVLNALLGRPYGWGGLYENRDCSALIQDVLAGFGAFVPRNSKDQAGAGRWVSLEGLAPSAKERRIGEQGKPLRTILYMPGHVLLYLGRDPVSRRIVAYHSMWGVRTGDFFQVSPGRRVIGRTVITTLEPGKELLPGPSPTGLLVDRLTGMALID
jgi:cell wall-associated NlpC family hydrolase